MELDWLSNVIMAGGVVAFAIYLYVLADAKRTVETRIWIRERAYELVYAVEQMEAGWAGAQKLAHVLSALMDEFPTVEEIELRQVIEAIVHEMKRADTVKATKSATE